MPRPGGCAVRFCDTPAVPIEDLRSAVVGHVEWVLFGRVDHLPRPGEVAHATDAFEEPAGGGAVAAVALARLCGACDLHTVLGEDEQGRLAAERLGQLGVRVHAGPPAPGELPADADPPPTRRAVTIVDGAGERTITTFGPRLDPAGADAPGDPTGWKRLREIGACYFTAGDLDALRRAREGSRVLVANPRARHALGHGVPLDALVLSADDEIELAAAEPVLEEAELIVYTEGEHGGRWRRRDGTEGRWEPAPLPGAVVDAYGAGDTFAAALTFGLGAGMALQDALRLAAERSAEVLTWAGPYGREAGSTLRSGPEN
jgi:ribokinase